MSASNKLDTLHNYIQDVSLVVELDTADINMLYYAIANIALYCAARYRAHVARYANVVQISIIFDSCEMVPFLLHSLASARSLQSIFRFWSKPTLYNKLLCIE
jgi:hypothetical protein